MLWIKLCKEARVGERESVTPKKASWYPETVKKWIKHILVYTVGSRGPGGLWSCCIRKEVSAIALFCNVVFWQLLIHFSSLVVWSFPATALPGVLCLKNATNCLGESSLEAPKGFPLVRAPDLFRGILFSFKEEIVGNFCANQKSQDWCHHQLN